MHLSPHRQKRTIIFLSGTRTNELLWLRTNYFLIRSPQPHASIEAEREVVAVEEGQKKTISPFHEGKVVFLHLLTAENILFIWHSVLQTKLYFCGVMETKLTFIMYAAQN